MVIPRAVVRDKFAENDSARVYSLLILILGISPILAPTLGGQMLGLTGWRGIFWVLAGVGAACTAAVAWGLPESLPREHRVTTGGMGQIFRIYGQLLGNRRFLGAILAAGFTLGALFAYLTASPFVFIELHRLTPQQYALVFGFNAVGMIAASQFNRWLIGRVTLWQVLSAAYLANAVAGLVLVAVVLAGVGGLPALIALIFLSMTTAGVIFPNIAALAMAPHGAVAGSASALLGVFQFGVAALSGALIGVFHDGTALPMAVGLAVCAVAGWAALRTMAR